MASDLPFYSNFVPQKVPLSKVLMTSLYVIWAPQSKTLATSTTVPVDGCWVSKFGCWVSNWRLRLYSFGLKPRFGKLNTALLNFGCWVSKWLLSFRQIRMLGFEMASKIIFFWTKTTFRQTKHSTFEFTTVNKYFLCPF